MLQSLSALLRSVRYDQVARDRDLLIRAMDDILQASARINRHLDDPHGDGSGRDAQSPDGHTFNDLDSEVRGIAVSALRTVGVNPIIR